MMESIMKRKSLWTGRDMLLKCHAATYTLFVVGIWWSVISTINYEGNAAVPFEAYRGLILNRVVWTIFWGLVFLINLAVHQGRSWWDARKRQDHLKTVSTLQERYISTSRLDLESQAHDDAVTQDDMWQYGDLEKDRAALK